MVHGYKKTILLKYTGTGRDTKTREFYNAFIEAVRREKLEEEVQVVRAADMGIYSGGVAVRIMPDDFTYTGVGKKDVGEIIEKSVKKDKPVKRLLKDHKDKQFRIVLRNCGVIDPESIEDYIAVEGYQGLKKAIFEYTPEEIVDELKASGLKGRGGGGFPAWMKWNFARTTPADQKYIICNADEGDPGAYMDRSILEGDPHSIIEGMAAAGFTTGADKGYVYIRAEYPLAIKRVQRAIEQARKRGLLGKKILGSKFNFDLEIRLGAGAFVCGEETALIASIEGERGCPRPRPPYPSVKGLWGKPTVINNVETLANIPVILNRGGQWFSGIGTKNASGTKVFALTGKVNNSSLIEVPMGITLREIIFDIGGGIIDGRDIKAVQTGGPSGGVIHADYLDTRVDYENLTKLGSIMGSGGMIAMDDTDCMVDIARFYMDFCVDESCGKCAPCRIGTYQMLDYLGKIADGKAVEEDMEKLEKICLAAQKASLCGLGQTAPNPIVSTMKYFKDEYLEHIRDKKCRAGKCRALLSYEIDQDLCRRCSLCARNCPVKAIPGSPKEGFVINDAECVKCGKCFEVCKFNAIKRG